jgi:hypothetical protein
LLIDVAAGLAATAISTLANRLFGAGHLRLPKFLGSFPLSDVRNAVAGVLGITLSAGISLSTSDHSHHMLSYLLWYGLAVLALIVVIACSIAIDRQRRGGSEASEVSASQAGRLSDEPPTSPAQECPTPMDVLRDGIRLQGSSKLTDAEVYPWAKEARLSVELRDPFLVKEFYRTFKLHRQDYFQTAYAIEAREEGLRPYLDRRVEIVEKAVEATRSRTVSS